VDQPNILPVPASHVQKLGFAREWGSVRTRATRAVARPVSVRTRATRAVARPVSVRKAPLSAHLSAHFRQQSRHPRRRASCLPPAYLTFDNFSESTIGRSLHLRQILVLKRTFLTRPATILRSRAMR
jgi:hypothetical protein